MDIVTKPKHAGGRPTKYRPEFATVKLREYLELAQDETSKIVKREDDKGTTYESKMKAHLPTHEGFAGYLGIDVTTIYYWEKSNKEFSKALQEIKRVQKERLLNNGLDSSYSPLITKLILSANHGMHERTEVDQRVQIVDLVKAQEQAETVDWSDTGAHLQNLAEEDTGELRI